MRAVEGFWGLRSLLLRWRTVQHLGLLGAEGLLGFGA